MDLTVNFFFFMIIITFITLTWWFSRYYFGKFLDKVSPFPLLREGGKYKYTNFQKDLTYQGQVLYTGFSVVVIFVSMFLSFGLNWVGWVLSFPFIFPALMLLLRIHTFTDDNILTETGRGYDVSKTYQWSIIGSAGLAVIFFVINISNNLILPIIALILILISGSIPIFPDYINKYLSYDIRTEKGQSFLEKLTMIFTVISWGFLLIFVGLFL